MQIELADRASVPCWYGMECNYRAKQPAAMVGGRVAPDGLQVRLDGGPPHRFLLCSRDLDQMFSARKVTIEQYGNPGVFSFSFMKPDPRIAVFMRALQSAGGQVWFDVGDDNFTSAWLDVRVREALYTWNHQRSALRVYRGEDGGLMFERGRPNDPFGFLALEALLYSAPSVETVLKATEEKYGASLERLQNMLCRADRVICATEVLAARVRPLNRNVVVLPNVASLPERPRPRKRDGQLRVGYSLTPWAHTLDLPLVLPALLEVGALPNVELHFFGLHPTKPQFMDEPDLPSGVETLNGVRFVFHGVEYSFQQYLDNVGMLDIAVMPLQDIGFNHAKSPQKWFEFSVHETVLVVSDSPAYACVKDGATGLKAKTPEDFTRLLRQLVADAELRRRIGRAAREDVLAHYTAEALGDVWRAGMKC